MFFKLEWIILLDESRIFEVPTIWNSLLKYVSFHLFYIVFYTLSYLQIWTRIFICFYIVYTLSGILLIYLLNLYLFHHLCFVLPYDELAKLYQLGKEYSNRFIATLILYSFYVLYVNEFFTIPIHFKEVRSFSIHW